MILVTGASGLVGRELMKQLADAGMSARGTDILAAGSPGLQKADLLDPAACRRLCGGIDSIVHTAALQHHSEVPRWGREAFFNKNAEMTRHMVEAARAAAVRHFVFVSSDMVYGLPPGRPITEQDEPRPIGPYGASKLASERACLGARGPALAVTILRPRLIIGPGRLGVLQKLFDRVRAGKTVPIFGRGDHRYQMVAVSDVAAAIVLALSKRREGVFNLGSDNPPPVRKLMADLCRRAGSHSCIVSLPAVPAKLALNLLHGVRLAPLAPEQYRIADVDYVLDTSAARRALGWQPRLADSDMMWSAYETYLAADRARCFGTGESGRPDAAGPNASPAVSARVSTPG
ncbi:MAG: epimerase [Planctomycetota bacterium]|nr:MAG: epimerase [Planctomycetota bacterium]